ncbi:MAG: type VI secretion system ATPase TssH, partial [Candidatus Omnitrophica bacterium]|nr:type VI secretion system ATPase TssH [Candidatus Omnitrophota bacterium]
MTIRFEKFTQKCQNAIQRSVELATELGHQNIEAEHLIYAFIKLDGSMFSSFLGRFNIPVETVLSRLEAEFGKKPSVEGGAPPVLSNEASKILIDAQKIADGMKDDF